MTPSHLTERVFVSRSTFRMLETLSMQQSGIADDERPVSVAVDSIAESILHEHLAAQPGMQERQKRIARFFKELAREPLTP